MLANKYFIVQKHIEQLAERINVAFQETEEERMKLNDWEWENEADFSILELIELYTPYVCGYARQIASNGEVQQPQEAANHLQHIQFFDKPEVVHWYLSPNKEYMKLKAYIDSLDYLRLSSLQYITLYQNGEHEAAGASQSSSFYEQRDTLGKAAA